MMAIIASLPLASSAFSLRFRVSASSVARSGGLKPRFPGSAVASVPGGANLHVTASLEASQYSAYARICSQPKAGTLEIAPRPFGMSSYLIPSEGDKYPGNLPVNSGVMYPMVASIDIRPCLISLSRRRLNTAASPSFDNPSGSKKPTGACTPSSPSKAEPGIHISGPVVPRKPFWNIIPVMATIARRPLASSALRARFLAAGSLMRSPRKRPKRPNSTLPKGPSSPVSIPGGFVGSCLALQTSMKPQKAKICAQPAPGTFARASRPFGMSVNFRSLDGDK
mmetsp:Transcript_93413/g.301930  ORF Transcript_93413/g.301930 Transcript_93413/m.301930 type:complete len:281 (+) Transcript_93413:1-843(+)